MIIRKKMYNNESAVSVLVGTLALILVVVVGVVSVATILGNFSTDVSKQTGTTDSVAATKTQLNIAGSDNMDLLTRTLGASYAEENPSIRIKSGVLVPNGIISTIISKSIDVGALAGTIDPSEIAKNPNIQTRQIGSSAVVVITNIATTAATYSMGDLNVTYTGVQTNSHGGAIAGLTPVYRSDSSGIADTFFKFTSNGSLSKAPSTYVSGAIPVSGNAALVDRIAHTPNTIGFADYGDVAGRNDVRIMGIDDNIYVYSPASINYTSLKTTAKYHYLSTAKNADGSYVWTGTQANVSEYSLSLICPLNYITKGNPNVAASGFLNFATSPSARPAFIQTNTFSIADF
jgi:ABC-type phosphate transport system substrate-binding protein